MKPRLTLLTIAVCLLGFAEPSRSIDINHFHPIPGDGHILTTDLGYVGPHLEFATQLFSHYMYQPLKQFTLLNGTSSNDHVDHRVDLELSISIALWRHIQIALLLPATAHQSGYYSDPYQGVTSPYSATGLDDLHLFVKAIFWENTSKVKSNELSGGIGLTADIAVPTVTNSNYYAQGNVKGNHLLIDGGSFTYRGPDLPEATALLKLVGHLRYRFFQVVFNLGAIVSSVENGLPSFIQMYSGFAYGIGAQFQIWEQTRLGNLSLFTEATGITRFARGDSPDGSFSTISSPAEFVLGAKGLFWNQLSAFLGFSAGLDNGYGAATFRAFLGIGWNWHPPEKSPPTMIPPPPIVIVKTVPQLVEVHGGKIDIPLKTFSGLDQDHPQPGDLKVLDAIALLLQARPDIKKIRIEGHTDNLGTDKYNLDLSNRRATFVKAYLIGKGVDEARLTTEGFGFRCPLVSNDTSDHQAQNRRVEFIIIEQEGHLTKPSKCTDTPSPRKP